jgi:hypothetical protein
MAAILHRIKAILYPNLLTEDPDDFYAKVNSEHTLGIDEICDSAVGRGNAPTSSEAMKINVELFFKEMAYQLKDGYAINTGYFFVGLDEIEVEITGAGDAGTIIAEVVDVKTGSVNDRITSDRNLRIRGHKLELSM